MEKPETLTPFEILNFFPQPLGPDQVDLKVWVDDTVQFAPEIKANIDKKWASLPDARNGDMLGLIRTEMVNGKLVLHTKSTDYRTYQGTNLTPENYTLLEGTPELLGNGLVCTAVIITADNKLVLGLRTNGKIGSIGGTVNTDETFPQTRSIHLFLHQNEEIQQELGLTRGDMKTSTTRLLAVSRSTTNRRPLLTFIHRTPLTSDEISAHFQTSGDKSEHSQILFIPNNPSAISDFLSHPPSPLQPAAVESLSLFMTSVSLHSE